MTVDAEPCAVPFGHENSIWFDCAAFPNESHQCRTVDGDFKECDLSNGVPLFEEFLSEVTGVPDAEAMLSDDSLALEELENL